MSQIGLVLIIAVISVGFFVLAISLTLIFKGRNIDSEIGENKHMKERGIKCAAQEIREQDRALRGEGGVCLPDEDCVDGNCGSCLK